MQRVDKEKVNTVNLGKTKYVKRVKSNDFLKYWRIIRYHTLKKYEISLNELEMMLYFYNESVFTRKQFHDFCATMAWDKKRFKNVIERGFVRKWREGRSSVSDLYELTQKSKLICSRVYKKLNGEESITENPLNNKIMKGDSYSDKIYRQMIKKMNAKP